MRQTEFKYIKRGKKKDIILIPGWATDHRIFDGLELEFNYLLPVSFSPFDFEEKLPGALETNGIEKFSILGFSMGAFLAAKIASKNPKSLEKLLLVGARQKYDKEELDKIKIYLAGNKKGYLYKFYNASFFKKEEFDRFKERLLKSYLKEMDADYLLATLDYLGTSELKPEALGAIKNIGVIHGEKDEIAPFAEAEGIKSKLPRAKLVRLKDTGHIPFFNGKFESYL